MNENYRIENGSLDGIGHELLSVPSTITAPFRWISA